MSSEHKAELFNAIHTGDPASAVSLLEQGVSANSRNESGISALQLAVASGMDTIVAQLLVHGATICNDYADEPSPFASEIMSLERLHNIRQIVRRAPLPGYIGSHPLDEQYAGSIETLRSEGIVRLQQLIDEESRAVLHRQFSEFVEYLDRKMSAGEGLKKFYDEEVHYWPAEKAYVTNNAFRFCPSLIDVALSPALLGLAEAYYQKPVFIRRAMAMRYLPWQGTAGDMFDWHHDVEDKQFKVMLLLTDVSDDDQYMSYISGSHLTLRPLRQFQSNRLELIDESGERVFKATGTAGDGFLFDTNGIHRANRNSEGAVRDVLILEYACEASDIAGGSIPGELLDKCRTDKTHPLHHMSLETPMWTISRWRSSFTWHDTLPFPGTWLSSEYTFKTDPDSLSEDVGDSVRYPLKLIYIVHADGLDETWLDRLRVSIDSANQQQGEQHFKIFIADYSTESIMHCVEEFLFDERQYFHQPVHGVFNRAWCINHAARRFLTSSDKYFLVSDIDIIFPTDFAEKCVSKYLSSGRDICLTAPAYYLEESGSKSVRSYADPFMGKMPIWRIFPGGCCLYSQDLFNRLGGFDEAYEGWGSEDEDLYERASAASNVIVDRSMRFLHIDHPRREDTEKPFVDENIEHFARKRDGLIGWCNWQRWGEDFMPPITDNRSGKMIYRYRRPRWTRFGLPVVEGDRYTIISPDAAFELNASAAAVYQLCTGQFSVGGIIDTLVAATGYDQAELSRDIMATIDHLAANGVIKLD